MLGKRKNKKTTRMDTLVGPQSEVVGDIKFSGGLHVEGTIKGNVIAENDGRSLVQLTLFQIILDHPEHPHALTPAAHHREPVYVQAYH